MAGSIKIVLDTCALIWWSLDPDKLSQRAKEACQQMEQAKNGLVPSTAIWEIAQYGSVNIFCHCERLSEVIAVSICHIIFPTGLS